MPDSTARAPRFESDSAPAPSFLWAPPQKPVSVSLPLDLIDRLEKEAVESFRSLSSRGSEIGGLLFGSFQPGSPLIVAVDSYEPVECEYARGPLYRLTDAELARLDRTLEQRLASGVRAVGFYRSHTRKGLGLDADDLALLDSRFPEAHQIALLVRPNATKASMAGIFIRENGKIHPEASCLEFPFRSAQHENQKRDQGLYDGAVAGPRSVAAAPAAARPVIRAQIVPIASRREVLPETPLPAPMAAVPEPPAPEPPPPPPAPVAVVEPPAPPTPAPAPAPTPAPVAAARPAPEPPPVRKAVAVEPEPEPEAPVRKSNKLLWIVLGSAATVVLASGFLFTSGILHLGSKTGIVAPQDTSALALRVERSGGDIVLTWNRDSAAIKNASKAMLSISDGPQQENVQMDLAQLRNGSIVYSPVTSDVVFKMEVTGADQMKTTSESVRVLRTRPSPMADPNEQQAQTPASGAAPSAAPKPVEAAPADATAAEPEQKVALAQAVKPFKRDSLATRLRPAADVADAPMLGAGLPAASAAPNMNLGGISAPPPPAPTPSAPAAPPTAPAAKPQVGGQVVQAQLVQRRDPEFPKLARDSGAGGMVELLATIRTDGRVGDVKVVKGHPLLRNAAVDAVKSWIYRPAVLNGKPVETQTSIYLNFKSDR